jgi:HlyD family secretion protein
MRPLTSSGALLLGSAFLAGALSGCGKAEKGDFLGSAVVEMETYQVPALTQGPLDAVLRDEGDRVSEGELIALVDTVPYALQYAEAAAAIGQAEAGIASQSSQIASLGAETRGARNEVERIAPLSKQGAATPQQLDRLTSSEEALRFRLEAARRAERGLTAQQEAQEYRVDFLRTQLRRCRILAPASGVVLTRYRNPGEAVTPGQSVFEIGRLDSVYADFFVPQGTLSSLRLGDTVRVRIEGEKSGEARHVPAVIRFIASEAEFTPKNIQTRESRSELVFRVRAEGSSQDGLLKRGLPVEIWR